MSGLLALLDDVAAIAKVAASSIDDVIAQAGKTGAKAAGAVVDDAAVTPNYVQGFSAERELPIVWRIARGSLFNKLVILLPIALLLSNFAPAVVPGLLLLGGAYLCYEGAEKVWHILRPGDNHVDKETDAGSPAQLEEAKVRGAIKTDFVLSAEIMTIALSAVPSGPWYYEAAVLAVVAIGITVLVYGSVGLIVKADDVGLHLADKARLAVVRAFGRGLVRAMPGFLKLLTAVGTAAMLWVGGSIVLHALGQLGFAQPEHLVHELAAAVAHRFDQAASVIAWIATALMDGLLGLVFGFVLLIPGHWLGRLFAGQAADRRLARNDKSKG